MLAKTPALVLGSVKYGDNSIILKTYTRQAGLKSFIASGLRSKKGVLRPAMVQPLSQLDLVYYDKSRGDLKRIKEATVLQAYSDIFYHPVKSSLSMFLAEILLHLLHEEEPNYPLYDFLSNSFSQLDSMDKGLGDFHLFFLYKLTAYVGFAPEAPKEHAYFDLMNGVYTPLEPPHPHYLGKKETILWRNLATEASKGSSLKLNRPSRESLLQAFLEYYRLHVNDFGHLRSLSILKELLA